jgi:hypothetical protein
MRKALVLLAAIGLAGSLWAADPSLGTWKLNIAKSKLGASAEGQMKEGTIVVRSLGTADFELTLTGTEADGTKTSIKVVWPQQGGMLKSSDAESGASSVVTMIAPGEWYTTSMQNGKQTQLIHSSISKDGKTMHLSIKNIDAQGKAAENLSVWDKQ